MVAQLFLSRGKDLLDSCAEGLGLPKVIPNALNKPVPSQTSESVDFVGSAHIQDFGVMQWHGERIIRPEVVIIKARLKIPNDGQTDSSIICDEHKLLWDILLQSR